MADNKVDYSKPTKETKAQHRAWRIGGLKHILQLLIDDCGKEKVKHELEGLEEAPFDPR